MKNLFLKNPVRALTGLALLLTAPVIALPASAQLVAPDAPQTNITSINGVFQLVNDIFNILFWMLIVLAGIFIIWAAFSYLTAGGDPEKVKQANRRVIYAAVAVVVGVLAKAIPSVVCSFISSGCSIGPGGIPQS